MVPICCDCADANNDDDDDEEEEEEGKYDIGRVQYILGKFLKKVKTKQMEAIKY